MLLQPPAESPWDLNFRFLGFDVRIAWTFWLGAGFLGYGWVQGVHKGLANMGQGTSVGILLIAWISCVFVSILIHELGHALAFRKVGIHSKIVLYHFGGMAIPVDSFQSSMSASRMTEKQDLFVTAAGPFAQLLSAALVIAAVRLSGYSVNLPLGLSEIQGIKGGVPISNLKLSILIDMYLWPSIFWAVLNLIPVWPLDGGRIARSLFRMNGGTVVQSLWLSVIAAAACALWGFKSDQLFLGLFFLMFAFENYQSIQQYGNYRF